MDYSKPISEAETRGKEWDSKEVHLDSTTKNKTELYCSVHAHMYVTVISSPL